MGLTLELDRENRYPTSQPSGTRGDSTPTLFCISGPVDTALLSYNCSSHLDFTYCLPESLTTSHFLHTLNKAMMAHKIDNSEH